MLGYWRKPEASREILDGDGWLNTGDQVEIRNGKIYIKGRTKDILVLSNGEKVPPQDVETAILSDEIFEQVMLVGEGRAYLTLLAVTQETDGKKLVRRANEKLKNFPRYIRVRRVIPLKEPWSIENGLLTPTLKVKRRQVCEKFSKEIEGIYGETG
jgi:long-chain acyl-CoA synthetase